jgi:hypothetical protein
MRSDARENETRGSYVETGVVDVDAMESGVERLWVPVHVFERMVVWGHDEVTEERAGRTGVGKMVEYMKVLEKVNILFSDFFSFQ